MVIISRNKNFYSFLNCIQGGTHLLLRHSAYFSEGNAWDSLYFRDCQAGLNSPGRKHNRCPEARIDTTLDYNCMHQKKNSGRNQWETTERCLFEGLEQSWNCITLFFCFEFKYCVMFPEIYPNPTTKKGAILCVKLSLQYEISFRRVNHFVVSRILFDFIDQSSPSFHSLYSLGTT